MKMYRQGDVAVRRVEVIPAGARKAPKENGRVILAHGEVTGHAHVLDFGEKLTEAGAEFFDVKGTTFEGQFKVERRWRDQVMVRHPKHGLIEFAVADVEVDGDVVLLRGEFGLLRHDEHTAHGLPAGFYEGAGAGRTVRQREYSPEAIRNVAD